jgi:hypothetical protein
MSKIRINHFVETLQRQPNLFDEAINIFDEVSDSRNISVQVGLLLST